MAKGKHRAHARRPARGVDLAHLAAEMYPDDPLAAARQAAFELSATLAAVLEQTGPVRLHKDYLERTDLVAYMDPVIAQDGTFEARICTPGEVAELRSTKGQQFSARHARSIAARATDPGSA